MDITKLLESIDYKYKNISNLKVALTHSSYANQKKNVEFNERLEFLGDAILELIITEYLFKNFENKNEGELTKLRAKIVCENSLLKIAEKWDLGKFLIMGKGEVQTKGREKPSILSDAVEAIIASVYLDSDFDTVRDFINRNFENSVKDALKEDENIDYKTKLQETVQKQGEIEIKYNLVKFEGPPHDRIFYTSVLINGENKGNGNGHTKKESEQSAAKIALQSMKNKNI